MMAALRPVKKMFVALGKKMVPFPAFMNQICALWNAVFAFFFDVADDFIAYA